MPCVHGDGSSTQRSGVSRRSNGNSSTKQEPESFSVPTSVHGDGDDASSISDNMSAAKSVASHTLDTIMSKIKDCQATLDAPINDSDAASIAQKEEAALLMQKLSAAAAAVKALE